MAAVMVAVTMLPASQPAASPGIALRARSFRPGELVVVSISTPPGAASVAVRAFGKDVLAHRVSPTAWQAIAGIDLDIPPGDQDVSATVDGVAATKSVDVVSRTFPVRKLTVNPDFVNPPATVTKRIEEESRLIERAYASGAPEPLWDGPFQRPVPHQANSRFGTRSVFNGEPRSPHAGTDFLSPAGTPVRAPNAGRVVVARNLFFAGNSVMVDHGAGLFSQLAHLSRIDVREGEAVRAGEVVGLVGATGRVTGAHLHWAVRASGARVDALSLLAVLGESASQ